MKTVIPHEEHVAKILKQRGFKIWKEPAGHANDFPDVGVSIEIGGKIVNLHIEVKRRKDTTMGQIRNWVYRNGKFSATKATTPNTDLLIDILNQNPVAKSKTQTILEELQKHVSEDVSEVSSSCLLVIKNVKQRNRCINNFIKHYSDSYHILSKANGNYGSMVLEHYRNKFERRPGINILMFFIDNQMFFVDTDDMPSKQMRNKVARALGVDSIPFFPESFTATVECRIQPSTLEGRGRARLDTILRLRASGLNAYSGPLLTRK